MTHDEQIARLREDMEKLALEFAQEIAQLKRELSEVKSLTLCAPSDNSANESPKPEPEPPGDNG